MSDVSKKLSLVKFVSEAGDECEYQGVVKIEDGKVWGLGRKGRKQFEICDLGQVYDWTTADKHR